MAYNRGQDRGYLSTNGASRLVAGSTGFVELEDSLHMGLLTQLLGPTGQGFGSPMIAVEGAVTSGYRVSSGSLISQIAGNTEVTTSGATTSFNDKLTALSEVVSTPTTAQQVDLASDTIAPTRETWKLINDTAGSITLTSTPHMSAGDDGEKQTLINVGAQDVVLQDDATLAGSDIFLKGAPDATRTLKQGQAITFVYDTDLPGWSEL